MRRNTFLARIAAVKFISILPGTVLSSLNSEYVSKTIALPIKESEQPTIVMMENAAG